MMRFTKSTWVCRTIPTELGISWEPLGDPGIGHVLECEVLSPSLHGRVETVDGRRAKLYPGDRIACVVGNRYATAMLEGVGRVTGEVIHLLSASGLCGEVVTQVSRSTTPTTLRVVSQAFVDGGPLSVRTLALPAPEACVDAPVWVAVAGSAMNAGKTTACASLINGLRAAGHRVGAAKLTGTASARDIGSFRDAGADPVLDFLDLGWPSTAGCTAEELHLIVAGLGGHLRTQGIDVAVLEIADGLLQAETDLVISNLATWLGDVHIVFAAQESLAAVAGVEHLAKRGHAVLAVTGVLTNSALARREVELAGVGPCLPTADLGREFAPRIAQTVCSAPSTAVDAVVA